MITCLNNNVIQKFENYRDSSRKIHEEANLENLVNPEIKLAMDADITEGCYLEFSTRKIVLNYRYLTYLWAIIYSMFFITETFNEEYLAGKNVNYFVPDTKDKQDAIEIFNWVLSVRKQYSAYPLTLPRPDNVDSYGEKIKAFIGNANAIYSRAVSFIMAHEFAHLSNKHDDVAILKLKGKDLTASEIAIIQEAEKEADNYALDYCLNDDDSLKEKITTGYALISVVLSDLLFCNISTVSKRYHTDVDDRLNFVFQKMNIPKKELDCIYHFACNICLQFFDREQIPVTKVSYVDVQNCFSDFLDVFEKYKA